MIVELQSVHEFLAANYLNIPIRNQLHCFVRITRCKEPKNRLKNITIKTTEALLTLQLFEEL